VKYQEEILNLEKSLKKTQTREETMQMEIENLKKDYERRFS
jgi:molecular chaperone GrpE (heat shock protein)